MLNNAISATKNNGKIIISTKLVECRKNDDVRTNDNDNNNEKNKMSVVVVSIKDKGTGIDPEIQPKLFTKFATKSQSGLGLGLYISKNIIEAHGGKICRKNNKDGIGSTFAFNLQI